MTTVGIVGLGKMGQAIASILTNREDLKSHSFHRISADNSGLLKSCDVVIEFTIAEAAPGVIRQCLDLGIPVVSGTTGWHEYHLDSILSYCKQKQGTLLYATNFSIGMNIVFALNRKLAEVMSTLPEFKPSIKEIHHIHKKDSPSGTAYTLIEDILTRLPNYNGFEHNPDAERISENKIPVTSIREGDVKGFHQVAWNSGAEQVTIAHEAFDRSIFAEGAVMAAVWLSRQPRGIYTMKDILHI
ncbi:MAG TPA: 4-hydroxy-tetrahydrodipicolinate reductase [Saprospiraceae bacterium]|nr:4-hydroxy-tetrahydrodipicolinate reductase [Saprospiraceae bacterium]